jgi:pyruvate/2-oxoglutarate dehydrogenase complex dihydrolipoamide acyltransferase (E2) component
MPIIQQIIVPLLSVNDTSLTVVDICYTQGSFIKKGDVILVFETSKTTYDVIAEVEGYIDYACIVHNDYAVNDIVANIVSAVHEVTATDKNINKAVLVNDGNTETNETTTNWQGQTFFSNAALQLINENGISTSIFDGKDFVTKQNVETILGINTKIAMPEKAVKKAIQKVVFPVDSTKVIVEKLSSNKKREIEYLSAIQATGLTSTINVMIETAGIFVHMNQSLQYLKNSLLPVIIYEASRLLQKYKVLNAYYTDDAIAFYNDINIGFAIDIDKGLKVLNIANANTKGIHDIENDIMDLSNKYIDDTLHINNLTDIGFTITDLSAESVAFFRPLINMMNSAILGIASIDTKLNRCMLSLTFDHRVTEGKLAAQFLHELKDRLESYQSKYFESINQHITCFKCYKTLNDDISDVGFAKCITPKGEEAFICQSCLKGF